MGTVRGQERPKRLQREKVKKINQIRKQNLYFDQLPRQYIKGIKPHNTTFQGIKKELRGNIVNLFFWKINRLLMPISILYIFQRQLILTKQKASSRKHHCAMKERAKSQKPVAKNKSSGPDREKPTPWTLACSVALALFYSRFSSRFHGYHSFIYPSQS